MLHSLHLLNPLHNLYNRLVILTKGRIRRRAMRILFWHINRQWRRKRRPHFYVHAVIVRRGNKP